MSGSGPFGCQGDHLACGGQHAPVTVEGEHARIHRPKRYAHPFGCFRVRDELVHVGAQDAHQEARHRHSRPFLEPLAQVDGLLAGDANAGFVQRFVNDGFGRGFAVADVAAGEAPVPDVRRDGAFHDVCVAELVNQDDVGRRRGLDPPHVRFFRVATGELVPVVPAGIPLAERVVALVTPEGDEAGVDGVAAVEVGH